MNRIFSISLMIFIFVVFSVGITSSYAETTWTLQTAGTGHDLWGIDMIDANTGIVVGGGGIFKTTNGGTTWIQVNPQGQSLWNLSMADANTGWAVGSGGTILKTTNGGTTWIAQSGAPFLSMRSVDCIDTSTCIIAGDNGTLLKTTNGGTTWVTLNSGVTTQYLNSVSFIDTNNAIIVGGSYSGQISSNIILKTTNGGTTWIAQTSGSTDFLRSVDFIDINNGITTGDGVILKTTNGGVTWTAASENTNQSLFDVQFIDANNAIAVFSGGTILKSTNGGTTWTSQSSGIDNHMMMSVDFIDADNVWVAGATGVILNTATFTMVEDVPSGPASNSQAIGTTTILGTCGLSFPDGNSINYGAIIPNSISNEVILNMTNSGSAPALLQIKGSDWKDVSNTSVIHGNYTHFNQTAFQNTYASKALLNATDGTVVNSFVPSALVKLVLQLQATLLNPTFTGSATQTMNFTVSC